MTRTAFGLRRIDGPLRTIAPADDGSETYEKALRICLEAATINIGCDHVMLIVRDEWYGGLGDRVAIFTSSKTSGALGIFFDYRIML